MLRSRPAMARYPRATLAAALLCLPAACSAEDGPRADTHAALPELGLMGTIPLYWGEAETMAEQLSGEGTPHWARPRLEDSYSLRLLDTLSEKELAGLDFLLLAQPRALSGAENVALDAWVRGGGHLLLFADPLLTGESRFGIGDRRRPQDVVLLSPILTHWGLELRFDMDQPAGFDLLATSGAPVPVNLPGSLVAVGDGKCATLAEDVLARCEIGAGSVVVLADAALLDMYEPHPAAGAALEWLLGQGFAIHGK